MIMHATGQTCPPRQTQPRPDPCESKFVVDLPILGEEEVSLPIDQVTRTVLNSAVFHLPAYLPIAYQQAKPFIDQTKVELLQAADRFVHRQMEVRVRPEIEAQKAAIMADIDYQANKVLTVATLLGFTVVGGVAVAGWWYYSKGRRR